MTEKNYKKVFKFWFGWHAEKIEVWLENMASKGWVLEKTGPNMTTFYFSKSSPCKISYCADFQNSPAKEYKALAEDGGWKLLSSIAGWFLWAKKYEGDEKPVFLSDRESIIGRMKKLLTFLFIIGSVQPLFLINSISRMQTDFSMFYKVIASIHAVALILMIWAGLTVWFKIRKLKKELEY